MRKVLEFRFAVSLFLLWTMSGFASGDRNTSQGKTPEKWLPSTVCELIKKPTKYDGIRVSLHAKALDGMGHGILLTDDNCNKGLRMLASGTVIEREDYTQFERTFYSARSITRNHEITGDFYGRFVYRPTEPRLKWALDVEQISNVKIEFPSSDSK